MKVMVTGGTGFVGSHAVRALLEAGHSVRLLVRSREKLDRVLSAENLDVGDAVVGDMADAAIVDKSLDGCDAVLHAAALFYGDEKVLEANVAGVRNVLGGAHARGLDPILYISTIAAMYPPPGPKITVDDPIVSLSTVYGRSKSEGEREARDLQSRGAPVVNLYPAGVYGPEDPSPVESTKGLRDALRFGWPITTTGISIIDVRDIAKVVVAALEPGRGPRRYMVAGHYTTWSEFADTCDRLTGRKTRRITAPPPLLRVVGRGLDLMKKVVSFDYPLTHEAALMMTRFVPCDSQPTLDDLGLEFRPRDETLRDAISWLHAAGHINATLAGELAG
jgi:dihydroflavonol-4-reductase